MQIIKEESQANSTKLHLQQLPSVPHPHHHLLPPPPHLQHLPHLQQTPLLDVRGADGQILHVNIDDISQFLTYHEVFGKMSTDNALSLGAGTSPLVPPISLVSSSSSITNAINNVICQSQNTAVSSQQQQQQLQSPPSSSSTSSVASMVTPKLETATSNIIQQLESPSGSTGNPTDINGLPLVTATHACDICGKMFAFKYQLIVHRRYHNERKPFICQVCGQAFTTTIELSAHGKSHDGNNMFTCNVCYHVFANDASLERHMKRHSTDKPFACSICLKTFARKEHLDNHFRSHTGETPFR